MITGQKRYYVYILRCSDGTLYTGFTTDCERRLSEHNSGTGAKYTHSRIPCMLVYKESFEDEHDARSREWHIKHDLSREEKEKLIQSNS
ncbi:MAG: GIY-YIG nuclease family protein [Saccharofermentans sp.]|nr:GIY-YIG nuclease family protein [Saccharofermentans sp.]MCI1274994.1 GIY-YIG nuclease family protein [Saccharofermentans sp.]MCI1769934.1 GIY-YIG nuclease family protein [Mageeibacillus sp.]